MDDQFSTRLKNIYDEILMLQTSGQKSASDIEMVSHAIPISVSTSDENADVSVLITPENQEDILLSATLDKLDGDSGNTYEVEMFFNSGVYYARVFFGNITSGSASANLTVVANDEFTMEVVNG